MSIKITVLEYWAVLDVAEDRYALHGQDLIGLTEFAEPADEDPEGHQVRGWDMAPLPGHNW